MNRKTGKISRQAKVVIYVIVGLVLLAAVFMLVAQFAAPSIRGAGDATAALTLIAGAAVVIERILEGFWTFVGLMRGSKWPLGPLSDQFTAVVGNLDTMLSPFYKEADAALQRVALAQSWTQARLEEARKELGDLQTQVSHIKAMAPDSQQVELVATSTAQVVEYIEKKYQDPQLRAAAEMATDSLKGINDLVASFKDNPGRRLISVYLGAFLGMMIAGVVGMDVFQATLSPEQVGAAQAAGQSAGRLFPYVGVAVTGLVIGFGSDPTHQVIEVLKEYKKARKAENALPA
jgi:hypothetical protein